MTDQRPEAHGRGAQLNPPNRFESVRRVDEFEQLDADDDYFEQLRSVPTEYLPDESRSIVSENDSPDVPFRYSVNPYRGCAHGCSYCYARPTHEYLGLSAGLDFESKIFVKLRAPQLFRDWLARDAWSPELIVFSGVTDCYQPAERDYRLTRQCLEVAAEARQPVGIITKNALVARDIDVLSDLAHNNLVAVNLSVTTLDRSLCRILEPRTSSPEARLRTVNELAAAGIPVNVMVAPVIPGLTDSEMPVILQAAAEAGASSAAYTLLRLPLAVEPIFLEWLDRHRPDEKPRIESRLRACRGGELSESTFGQRMRGSGEIATQIAQTFRIFSRKFALDRERPELSTEHFRPPKPSNGQLRLF
ncbi:PA0069 family radical SAM protein [bacterium]|nr:PA0069 family radical SAM protein [bacterium]